MPSDKERFFQSVAEASIANGERYDISSIPEMTMLAVRAAHSAKDELDHIISGLQRRRADIEDDLYSLLAEYMSKEHKVRLDKSVHMGIQIDWADKTIDLLTREVIDHITRKKGERK
jgi:predicted secreted protein